MAVPGRYMFLAFVFALLPAAAANATCNNCQRPPVQTCQHNCAPPQHQPCTRCAPPTVIVPPPYVPPPNVVVVNAGAQAQASSVAIAIANVRQGDVIVRGGGGGGFAGAAVAAGVSAAALSVTEGAAIMESASRSVTVQAICLDATGNPHPASQTFGERTVDGAYTGEIFRCMAGTKMRVTHDGRSFDCDANEALWHENGALTCKTQIARRPCNERSLLRRYGPGEKVITLREQRQATRETQFNAQMTMDGGVGQGVW